MENWTSINKMFNFSVCKLAILCIDITCTNPFSSLINDKYLARKTQISLYGALGGKAHNSISKRYQVTTFTDFKS